MTHCSTWRPAAEDSPDREAIDQFADFLRAVAERGRAAVMSDPAWQPYISGDGDAIDPAAVTTSPDAAVLYREAGWDYNRISVTYLAGYRVQPATDVMGARMLLRWLWQSQRGTIRRTAENWAPGDGWDLPNAVVGQWRDSTLSGFG